MRSLFWRLLHRYGPEWAIHRFCYLCRTEGLCPKCLINWDAVEPAIVPKVLHVGTSTTGRTTKWTFTDATKGVRRDGV